MKEQSNMMMHPPVSGHLCQAASDPGKTSHTNEDAYVCQPSMGLYIVCDGKGENGSGRMAASLASTAATTHIQDTFSALTTDDLQEKRESKWYKELIEEAIQSAGKAVYSKREEMQNQDFITTLTLLWLDRDRAFIGHVGDTRVYLLRQDNEYLLTEDHTLSNELLKIGRLKRNQTSDFPFTHALSRSLGQYPTVHVDILELSIFPGDQFLLCSKGLHRYLGEGSPTVRSFFPRPKTQEGEQQETTPSSSNPIEALIQFANESGGKDNITAIAIEVPAIEETTESKRSRQTLNVIQSLQLFDGLSYKDYVEIINSFDPKLYQEGQQIITQGSKGDALFIIVDGEVRIQRGDIVINRLAKGEHFGELSIFDESPRFADAFADTACHLIVISRDRWEQFHQENPTLGMILFQNIVKRLTRIVREQSLELLERRSPQTKEPMP